MGEPMSVTITLDGKAYTFWPDQLTAKDSRTIRAELGMGIPKLLRLAQEDPDIDVIAGLVWIARRQAGETVTLDEIGASITYGTDFGVDDGAAAIPEDHPSS